MVWPFSSKIHNQDRIQAHLRLRDEALALSVSSSRGTANAAAGDVSVGPQDREILSADFAGITSGIQSKRWTAVDVLHAFIRSARRAHLRTNCITEVNFDQALARAAQLDRQFEQTGELVGPLHGVPISIKEHYPIKGVPLTLGFSSWLQREPSPESASVVLLAEHLGAVPFVKTNVPQTMLAFESRNPVYGQTTNPYSPNHTCGGSSGGESALIACDGSAAGVGSDIGGSLRIPVGYCGVYSLKPCHGIWPMEGSVDYARGFEGIHAVAGPICRSARDVQAFHTAVVKALEPPRLRAGESGDAVAKALAKATDQHEQLLKRVGRVNSIRPTLDEAWFEPLKVVEQRGTPLRVGYYFTEGLVKTTPASYRAVKESIAALEAKYPNSQIELVPLPTKALDAIKSLELFLGISSADGYAYLTEPHLGKDKRDPTLLLPLLLARLPSFVKRIIAFVARYVLRDDKMARLVTAAGMRSAKRYFQTIEARSRYCDEWSKRVWDGYNLDAIICPVQASPAVPHGGSSRLSMMCISTAMYNILDCAAAVVPVTRVDAAQDSHRAVDYATGAARAASANYVAWAADAELNACSHLVNYELYSSGVYDAKKMQGLPVAVQVVTRPYQEEKAIGIMRLLDDALPPIKTRGGPWRNQLNDNGSIRPVAAAPTVEPGFGPGTYTARVYAGKSVQ